MSDTKAVIAEADIRKITDLIKEQFSPEKIIVFGSFADGTADKNSDLDILVILETDLSSREAAFNIRRSLVVDIPIDIIVRTPAQIEERIQKGDLFFSDIIKHGRIA